MTALEWHSSGNPSEDGGVKQDTTSLLDSENPVARVPAHSRDTSLQTVHYSTKY